MMQEVEESWGCIGYGSKSWNQTSDCQYKDANRNGQAEQLSVRKGPKSISLEVSAPIQLSMHTKLCLWRLSSSSNISRHWQLQANPSSP